MFAAGVGHVHVAVRGGCNAVAVCERSDFGPRRSVGRRFEDLLRTGVGDVDIAAIIDRDSVWIGKCMLDKELAIDAQAPYVTL